MLSNLNRGMVESLPSGDEKDNSFEVPSLIRSLPCGFFDFLPNPSSAFFRNVSPRVCFTHCRSGCSRRS